MDAAHELGHWYYLHPTKMMLVSQLHLFSILALFPAFLHAPPVLRAFDFPAHVAARPPTIVAFMLFQVRYPLFPSLLFLSPIHVPKHMMLTRMWQMIIAPLESVAGIALNAVSRRFEYQADQFACELRGMLKAEEMADMGDRLGRALITLHVKNLSTVWVDWL